MLPMCGCTEGEQSPLYADLRIGKGRERSLRTAGFLLVNVILRWPIWILLGVLRVLRPIDYLFLVYPGTDSDLEGYCPRWLAKSRLFSSKPVIGGIISKPKGIGGRGLVLVVPNTARELLVNRDACRKILRRLGRLKSISGAASIAVAGQGPGIFIRHRLELTKPFVRGHKGTTFCVMETIAKAMRRHGLEAGKFSIAVVGVGFVGGHLLDSLLQEGHDAVGIDIKLRRHGVFLPRESYPILNGADMVVVLTPRGSDFTPYVSYLKPGVIVIDDTHPGMTERPAKAHFYKVVVGLPGVRFFPRLPGFRKGWIPGCVVEALHAGATGEYGGIPQKALNQRLRRMGFYAHI